MKLQDLILILFISGWMPLNYKLQVLIILLWNGPLVAEAIITEREGPLQCSRNAKQAVSAVKHKKRYVIYFFRRNIC